MSEVQGNFPPTEEEIAAAKQITTTAEVVGNFPPEGDLLAGLMSAGGSPTDSVLATEGAKLLNLDDIRTRVMADLPITLEEEKLLVGSIRRGYSMMFEASVKKTRSSSAAAGKEPRTVAASATGPKGKKSASQMFEALGGLDALKL